MCKNTQQAKKDVLCVCLLTLKLLREEEKDVLSAGFLLFTQQT